LTTHLQVEENATALRCIKTTVPDQRHHRSHIRTVRERQDIADKTVSGGHCTCIAVVFSHSLTVHPR